MSKVALVSPAVTTPGPHEIFVVVMLYEACVLIVRETFPVDVVTAANDQKKYGGINLDPALLDLQIKRDGNGVPLPMNLQPFDEMNIKGFIPIIINITPINNLPVFLGMVVPALRPGSGQANDNVPPTANDNISPADRKARFEFDKVS